MSYFRRNEGTIVFAFASLAFIAFYCINYFFRRCRNRDVALAAGDTEEAVSSPNRPPRGLDAKGIESLPSFIYTEANGIGPGQGELVCAVCLNAYKEDEMLRLVLPCGHVFHVDCVDIWLSHCSTCPICRADVTLDPVY
ncbi:RING-H2 finger protein ATL39 [Raphanus sativus]|uniref:RING-type E3 ubiquitin transferase n=1 Tax=Raphanus sativus TaxID=3726 RepID=A0A6J0L820_RAPSA|nr:RING-H2 finger protein ATL39 [Raphanus sativus]KAJ4876114.1 RING-H2 finger protein ATL39 [Raphanus sativus]